MPNPSDPWTDWYDAHAPALLLLARQWAPTPSDAEDIVHDAFIRFWPRRHSVQDAAAFLFTCVRRRAIDYARSAQRRKKREADLAAQPDRAPMFEPAGAGDERRTRAEAALATLPPEQREVVTMKLWGGLTFGAIGEATGVSPNTAASRYRYAMIAMKQMLCEEPAR